MSIRSSGAASILTQSQTLTNVSDHTSQKYLEHNEMLMRQDERDLEFLLEALRKDFSEDKTLMGLFKTIFNNPMIKHIQGEVDTLLKKYGDLRRHIDTEVRSLKIKIDDTERALQSKNDEIRQHDSVARKTAEKYIHLLQTNDTKKGWFTEKDQMFSKEDMIRILETTLQINQENSPQATYSPTIHNTGPHITVDSKTAVEGMDLILKNKNSLSALLKLRGLITAKKEKGKKSQSLG
jgi:hypothetical protein